MAVILNNLMGYQIAAKSTFQDVTGSEWYADAIMKANTAGVLDGDGHGHANPTLSITREQAAVMLARALGVDADNGAKTSFRDSGAISDWAKGLVFGMEEDKYIGGMGDRNFSPTSNITRAQVVTMIDNAVADYYTSPGNYSSNALPKVYGGNCAVIVRTSGVIIKGSNISGDLIVAEGVAKGEFTLNGAIVSGKMIVRGGGENSIEIINGAEVGGSVSIEKVGGKIRIVSNGKTIKELETGSEVILEGNFSNVSVAEGAAVEVRGQINNISVQAKAEVTITKEAKVDSLSVEKAAEGAKIEISGTVATLRTEAPKTDIFAKSTANITTIEAGSSAAGTNIDIDGKASVNTVKSDTTITKTGDGTPKTISGSGSVEEKSSLGGRGGGGGGGEAVDNKSDQSAPTGLAGVSPTSTANNDGKITGVSSAMEYKLSTESTYHSISSTVLTGLVSGVYHIRYKEDSNYYASPAAPVGVPEFEAVYQYGIVKDFAEKTTFDNAKTRLHTADDAAHTYYISEHLDVELSKGQIVAFGLNEEEEIGALDLDDLISVESGLTILSPTALSIDGTVYDIWEQVTVFTYDGATPGATNCSLDVHTIDNIVYNSAIGSPSSVYLDIGGVIAIFLPESAVRFQCQPVYPVLLLPHPPTMTARLPALAALWSINFQAH